VKIEATDASSRVVNQWNDALVVWCTGTVPSGASGTFNYLVDLITQVPHTRQMYMRRLRTITDAYYPSGKLVGVSKIPSPRLAMLMWCFRGGGSPGEEVRWPIFKSFFKAVVVSLR
jgi:hypothetical protein